MLQNLKPSDIFSAISTPMKQSFENFAADSSKPVPPACDPFEELEEDASKDM